MTRRPPPCRKQRRTAGGAARQGTYTYSGAARGAGRGVTAGGPNDPGTVPRLPTSHLAPPCPAPAQGPSPPRDRRRPGPPPSPRPGRKRPCVLEASTPAPEPHPHPRPPRSHLHDHPAAPPPVGRFDVGRAKTAASGRKNRGRWRSGSLVSLRLREFPRSASHPRRDRGLWGLTAPTIPGLRSWKTKLRGVGGSTGALRSQTTLSQIGPDHVSPRRTVPRPRPRSERRDFGHQKLPQRDPGPYTSYANTPFPAGSRNVSYLKHTTVGPGYRVLQEKHLNLILDV